MFDWKGYVITVLRNVVSVCSFIGGVCAFLSSDVLIGVLFVILYAIVSTDESWFVYEEDDEDET